MTYLPGASSGPTLVAVFAGLIIFTFVFRLSINGQSRFFLYPGVERNQEYLPDMTRPVDTMLQQ